MVHLASIRAAGSDGAGSEPSKFAACVGEMCLEGSNANGTSTCPIGSRLTCAITGAA